jgi:3-hydroxyacyl-CoA dehydrogenase
MSSTRPETGGDIVACLGTGTIGRSWAVAFARTGKRVRLYDDSADALAEAIDWIAGARDGGDASSADLRARVTSAATLEAAVAGAVYVQESVVEDMAVKREVFAALDRVAPDGAVLASSTSALPASAFTDHLKTRERCLVAHPASPPHLLPAVEVVASRWTAPATRARADALLRDCGMSPVDVRTEKTGFVMNRLQAALVNEAMALIAEGVIEARDLDALVVGSLGRRWAVVGPLQAMALNAPGGFADYARRYAETYRRIGRSLAPGQAWDQAAVQHVSDQLGLDQSESARTRARVERDAGLTRVARVLAPELGS